jgi:4-alpha-glucanotransferase
MSLRKKRLGTVLSITSLVSKTAQAGTFAAGEKFIDWLAKTKQNAWQVLPLHQTQLEKGSTTKHIPSPYKGYGVGLDPRFLSSNDPQPSAEQLTKFIKNNHYWLEEYTLFCALRDQFETDDWSQWPTDIRKRNKNSVKRWQKKLTTQINSHIKTQAQLHLAYEQLQKKAADHEILLIGDLPLYLSLNSPLVWQYQNLFDINLDGKLQKTSGVPIGPKSHFGRQIWGHPLYKWQDKNLIPKIDNLFKIRLQYLAHLFDWVRLDHAKGLFFYAQMDLTAEKKDRYLVGPGRKSLEKIIDFAHKQNLSIYAEDTGDNLKELRECLQSHQTPGIKVFRYAYDEKRKKITNQYLEVDKYQPNSFAYTTTHDTETLMGYLQKLSTAEVSTLSKKLNINETKSLNLLAELIRNKIINSPSKMVLISLQDWLYTTERINIPGTEKEIDDPNWRYQMNTLIENLPIEL